MAPTALKPIVNRLTTRNPHENGFNPINELRLEYENDVVAVNENFTENRNGFNPIKERRSDGNRIMVYRNQDEWITNSDAPLQEITDQTRADFSFGSAIVFIVMLFSWFIFWLFKSRTRFFNGFRAFKMTVANLNHEEQQQVPNPLQQQQVLNPLQQTDHNVDVEQSNSSQGQHIYAKHYTVERTRQK